ALEQVGGSKNRGEAEWDGENPDRGCPIEDGPQTINGDEGEGGQSMDGCAFGGCGRRRGARRRENLNRNRLSMHLGYFRGLIQSNFQRLSGIVTSGLQGRAL